MTCVAEAENCAMRVLQQLLGNAVMSDHAERVGDLLHCARAEGGCSPEQLLKCNLKAVHTASVARAFARAEPAFFFEKGYGAMELIRASREGRADSVRAFLAAGVAADAIAPWMETKALPSACIGGHAKCVQVLLACGADPNQIVGELTPLHLALLYGHEECVEVLLQIGVEPKSTSRVQGRSLTPLHFAASCGFPDCVHALLKAGADPHARDELQYTPLHYASKLHNWVGMPPKREYTQTSYVECCLRLIWRGADMNAVGGEEKTPLFCAAAKDDAEIVKVLLENGADPRYRTSRRETILHVAANTWDGRCLEVLENKDLDVNAVNADGETPLLIAIRRDTVSKVTTLLRMGADPSLRQPDGFTTLHRAADFGNSENVKLLLGAGADPSWTYAQGINALHLATQVCSADCVVALVEGGADVNAPTANGKTALHFAAEEAWPADCLELLLELGATLQAVDERGWNALHFASSSQGICNMDFLVKRGLSMDDRTSDGQTPLHLLTNYNPWCVGEGLSKFGVNARDYTGSTPLHVAARNNDEHCVRVLLCAGAQPMARDENGDSPADVTTDVEVEWIIRLWALAA